VALEEAERLEFLEARRRREALTRRRMEVRRQKGWEELALPRLQREETQRQDEVCEARRLADMQLRLQR
jgi:hypothetical protein